MKREEKILQVTILGFFLVVLLAAQLLILPDFGDDLVYVKVWAEKPLDVFLKDRYDWWSSRVVIEAVMMCLVAAPSYLWRILNIMMVLLLVWITGDLFGGRKKLQAQLLFFGMMWLVPMISLCSAGWITTTVNYLWCLVLGFIAMRPIKHWLQRESCAKWEYVICPLCILYAANMEQMGAILLGVYLVFGIYLLAEQKRISPFYVIQLVLIVLSLYFILVSPGNYNRNNQEIERYFPEFANMTFGQKIFMGFLENTQYYIAGGNDRGCFVFAALAGVLFLCYIANGGLMTKTEKPLGKMIKILIAGYSLFVNICCSCLFPFLLNVVNISRARNFFGVLSGNRYIPGQSYYSDSLIMLQVMVYLLVIICVVLTIYMLHGRTKETLLQLLILAAGFTSRVIMGFSPTVYASGDRTALFCSMAILIVMLRNIQLWLEKEPKVQWKVVMAAYIAVLVACNLL